MAMDIGSSLADMYTYLSNLNVHLLVNVESKKISSLTLIDIVCLSFHSNIIEICIKCKMHFLFLVLLE